MYHAGHRVATRLTGIFLETGKLSGLRRAEVIKVEDQRMAIMPARQRCRSTAYSPAAGCCSGHDRVTGLHSRSLSA
jgi:hypothetical protein